MIQKSQVKTLPTWRYWEEGREMKQGLKEQTENEPVIGLLD